MKAPVLLIAVAMLACSSSSETKDTVPARSGFEMPEAGAAKMSEVDACASLSEALSSTAGRLGCSAPPVVCPSYVRPAGGEGCFEYSASSVEECKKIIQRYTRCSEFTTHRCIVTALKIAGQCAERPPDAGAGDAESDGGVEDDGAADAATTSDGADAPFDAGGD